MIPRFRAMMTASVRSLTCNAKILLTWNLTNTNKCATEVQAPPKPRGRLTVQIDELWSFVDNKGNQQWVWLAIDVDTREIVGVYIGDRSATSAQALRRSMPTVYRQCAVIYSDFWSAYGVVLRSKRHGAVGKETGSHQLYWTVQLYTATAGVPIGQKNLFILQEVRQPHWCDLEFYSSLQCFAANHIVLSCLGLPELAWFCCLSHTLLKHNRRYSSQSKPLVTPLVWDRSTNNILQVI